MDPACRAEDAEVRIVMGLSVVGCVRVYHCLAAVSYRHPHSQKVGMLKGWPPELVRQAFLEAKYSLCAV